MEQIIQPIKLIFLFVTHDDKHNHFKGHNEKKCGTCGFSAGKHCKIDGKQSTMWDAIYIYGVCRILNHYKRV